VRNIALFFFFFTGFHTNLSAAQCFVSSPQGLKWVVTLSWGGWYSTKRPRWEEQRTCVSSLCHSWHCWCHPYMKIHQGMIGSSSHRN